MSATASPLAGLARIRARTEGAAVVARDDKPADAPGAGATERCGLCAESVPDGHRHLVDLAQRSLVCVCPACRLLFDNPGAGAGRLRSVPDRFWRVEGFELAPGAWDAMGIPVSVAFFFESSEDDGWSAFLPGPAGATQCMLPLDAWTEVVTANPVLANIEPDVEAALVRVDPQRGGTADCFVVPIDACYELAGRLRSVWRGFDGGTDARATLATFFDRLAGRSRPVSTGAGNG